MHMKAGLEILRIFEGSGIKMNFARIMFCLECHGRSALVAEEALDSLAGRVKCGLRSFLLTDLPAEAFKRDSDVSHDGRRTISPAILTMAKTCPGPWTLKPIADIPAETVTG